MISYSQFKPLFKTAVAQAVYNEVLSNTSTYHHWIGKENTWQDYLSPFIPSSTSDVPGAPQDNFRYELHVRRDILTTKKITTGDVSLVIRRIDWVSGTVYDIYDDAYAPTAGYGYGPAYSGAGNLADANFYVLTSDYNVYKCIDNNNNAPSIYMPTGASQDIFTTTDGYKWKFMYAIPISLRNRFLSSQWMPVLTALTSQFYSNGTINNVIINNGGSGYSGATGVTTAVVTGDGYLAANPAVIKNEFVIGATGSGYTSATVTIAPPFSSAIAWASGLNVDVGSYIYYENTGVSPNVTNFYYVLSGTVLGTSGPVFTSGTSANGAAQLQYVGTTAMATATVSSGKVTGITLTNAGYGYSSAPGITITGDGTSATATSVIEPTAAQVNLTVGAGGVITGYTIVDGGVGYTNAALTIIGATGAGSGAVLSADLNIGNVNTLQANVELLATHGTIEVIKMVDEGSGYGSASVTILGDGTDATATAVCSGGRVTSITITNPGSGYTWTDIVITGNGTGAKARAIMSPLGGHGSNAVEELFASSLLFYSSFSNETNQGFIINNDYRKCGLLRNLQSQETGVQGYTGNNGPRFQGSIGSGCVLITGVFDVSKILPDMLLYKVESEGQNYKKFRVVDFNNTQILLSVFNDFAVNSGDTLITDPFNINPDTGVPLIPNPTVPQTTIGISSVTNRTINPFSGDFLFVEVMEPFSPSPQQIVTVRTLLTV